MLQNLMKFIQLAQKIVPKRSTLPILTCVCVEDGYIRATDLETTIRMPIDDKRNYTLPFGVLKSIMKSKPQEIEIDLLPNRQAKLSYDGRDLLLKTLDPDDFPLLPKGNFKSIATWPNMTIKALGCMTAFTSKEELKEALRGVYVKIGEDLTFAATDGHLLRETRIKLDGSYEKAEFKGIIPVLPLDIVTRCAGSSTEVSCSKSHIKFTLPSEIEIFIRLIDEKYPPYEEFVNGEKENSVEFLKNDMTTLIKEAKEFTDKTTYRAELVASNGSIELRTDDHERELSFESSLPGENRKGGSERTGFNLKYLEKVIKSINGERIRWEYSKPIEASYFRGIGKEDEGITNLLMPVRLED
ncbi:hypothetical protein E3V55_04390 [Candidatus Marinimicrobia bacterium MT.SAG.3]|nr:hypothetical protein E3V55_04390 [Candidatus Marinimicrobia bacterium MT.SAG.3]